MLNDAKQLQEVISHSDQKKKTQKEMGKCQKRERHLLRRISNAPDKLTQRVRIMEYLKSDACRIVALVQQAKDLPTNERPTLTECTALAASFSLFHPIIETTNYWDKPRSSGNGFRRIHEFGPMNRAAQYMIMRIISAFFKPKPFQYSVSGRGVTKAILRVKNLLETGYRHVLKMDVRDFFGSFSRDGIYSIIPFPKTVIDHVVMPDQLQLKPKKGNYEHGKTDVITHTEITQNKNPHPSLPVLPQGSLHAPILAEHVVSLLKIDMPQEVRIVIFVDDILILSKTADGLETAKDALCSTYGASPAGKFQFKISKDQNSSGFTFLGYRILTPAGCAPRALPSLENEAYFKKKCATFRSKITKSKKVSQIILAQAIVDLFAFQIAWVAGFRAADDFSHRIAAHQKNLISLCLNLGLDPIEVKNLCSAKFAHTVVTIKIKGQYHQKIDVGDNDESLTSFS